VSHDESPGAQNVRVLAKRNIDRIDGVVDPSIPKGYLNHPDYGEIGEIVAEARMLDGISAGTLQANRVAW
jgi:hypothetical protein